ncbi:MAG: Hsp20/alpha crystallin family protein [Ignavibacteriaceae bacterium]
MNLTRINPAKDLLSIEKEFNRLFNSFGNRFGVNKEGDEKLENAVWMPLTDIIEDKDNFFLNLDLPGVKKEDVKIAYNQGTLTISGERKQESETKEAKFHRIERSYGSYYRSFTLPEKIKEEEIQAEFRDGTLKVVIPKSEEVKPKEISIKVK